MKKPILFSIIPACFLFLFIFLNSFETLHTYSIGVKMDHLKLTTTGIVKSSDSYHLLSFEPDGYLSFSFHTYPGIPMPDSVRIIIYGYGIDTIVPGGSFYVQLPTGDILVRWEADGYVSGETDVYLTPDQLIVLNITLSEFPYPVISVHADLNHQPNIPFISWYKMQDCHQYKYDDGITDSVFAWPEEGNMAAVRFTPESYPAQILGAEVNIYNGTWPPGNLLTPFQMALYDDDGANGLPGTQMAFTTIDPFRYGWVYADFSSENIVITEGDFYIAKIQEAIIPTVPR
jgi:hypothetical protein